MMKKIAIFLILLLVPLATMGFFIGPGNMMGMSQKPGVAGGPSGDALILESGTYFLILEAEDYLLLE